jgi:hypothetical protein
MTKSLEIFMHRLIDYAGLFPPAELDMPTAAQTFARHLDSDFSWMLGSFICPAGRLDELAAERRHIDRHAPISVSVLGTRPGGQGRFEESAAADAAVVTRLEKEGWMRALQLEVKWPLVEISTDALNRYIDALTRFGCTFERFFFEIDRTTTWERDVIAMARALRDSDGPLGFKIRTGGVTAELYPNADEVASAIQACRETGIPLKATAGLHHPIRHRRTDPAVMEHGFFNVFGAAVLAHSASVDRETLLAIIQEEVPASFQFDLGRFRWNDHVVTDDELRAARSSLAFSFGSCSFDEPLEDLSEAGLL